MDDGSEWFISTLSTDWKASCGSYCMWLVPSFVVLGWSSQSENLAEGRLAVALLQLEMEIITLKRHALDMNKLPCADLTMFFSRLRHPAAINVVAYIRDSLLTSKVVVNLLNAVMASMGFL